jgi:DNA-directed RNA polymerase specialized sigma24 family protein
MAHDLLIDMIERISRSLGREYEVDYEDVRSELHVWYLENKDKAQELLDMDRAGLLDHRLTSIARRFCAKERAQSLGYDPSDIAHYNLRSVRELLPDVFDYNNWQSAATFGDGQPRSKPLANQGMDRVSMLIDIKQAVSRLPEEQYNVILWVYKYGYTTEQLAAELEVTLDAAQKRVQRAVRKVQALLTEIRPMDVPQRRAVLNNAASRAVQSGHWEG